MSINQIFYNIGLALLALSLVGGTLAALLLARVGKSLRKQLESEYGKPRHN